VLKFAGEVSFVDFDVVLRASILSVGRKEERMGKTRPNRSTASCPL
jgi:hypothetical protein